MSTSRPRRSLTKIVSGGQTGVDRGALEAAMAFGLNHGGWCPLGRLAEDGAIPSRYQLTELESPDYAIRTERNVDDSDATLILHQKSITGGTRLTLLFARRLRRPHLVVRMDQPQAVSEIVQWLLKVQPQTLNVAGPRGSSHPGIEERACSLMLQVLEQLHSG